MMQGMQIPAQDKSRPLHLSRANLSLHGQLPVTYDATKVCVNIASASMKSRILHACINSIVYAGS